MKTIFSLLLLLLFASYFSHTQELVWNKLYEGSNPSNLTFSITKTIDNNFHLIAGTFEQAPTLDFNFGSGQEFLSTNTPGVMFLQKVDIDGGFIWVKKIDVVTTIIHNIEVDVQGNIFVCLRHSDSDGDIDPGPNVVSVSNGGGGYRTIILKLSSNGDYIWHQQFDDSETSSISLDPSGNIYVAGEIGYYGTNLGGMGIATVSAGTEVFLAKLNNDGVASWIKRIGNNSASNTSSIYINKTLVHPNGQFYYCGTFEGAIDFNPGSSSNLLNVTSNRKFFIASLDGNGNYTNSQAHDITNNSGRIIGFQADNNGDIIVSGQIANVSQVGTTKLMVKKCSHTTNQIWNKLFQISDLNTQFLDMTVDAQNNINLAGEFFDDSLDLNPNSGANFLNSVYIDPNTGVSHYKQGFALKLDNDGNYIWAVNELIENNGDTLYFESIKTISSNQQGEIFVTKVGYPTNSFVKIGQDLCALSNFGIQENHIQNVSCSNSGIIDVSGTGGYPQYNYYLNNVLQSTTPISISNLGTYTVSVEDQLGCQSTSTYIIDGPNTIGQYDNDIQLITTEFRPGFSTNIWLDAFNTGCISSTGQVSLTLDSNTQFNYGWPTPSTISGNILIWDYQNLNFESNNLVLFLNVTTDTAAQIGDSILFDVLIDPIANDFNPINNSKSYIFPVVNGYDPNDKKVFPFGKCDDHFVDVLNPLTFTIRFQNTGNSEAININVIDSLPQFLNPSSIRILTTSDPVLTRLIDTNVVLFEFNNINLPDSSSNEIESHGYLVFEIYPNITSNHLNTVENNSNIYFDFNPPITTNYTFNTLYDSQMTSIDLENFECSEILSNDEDFTRGNINLFPNPTKGIVTISNIDCNSVQYKITGLSGTIIQKDKQNFEDSITFDFTNFKNGIYFIHLECEQGTKTIKVVKE